MSSQLATAASNAAEVQADPKKATVLELIQQQQGAIERALPRHLDAERFTRIVLTEVRRTPGLLRADPMSLLASLMLSAQLGLEPGPLGHVYFLPFRNAKENRTDVQFIIGYKGMVDLARRSGQVSTIYAESVHEGDTFSWRLGLNPDIEHQPAAVRGELTHVYAVAKYKDGGFNFVVLTRDQVESYRARSKAKDSGPWRTDFEAMAKKTAIRRLFPMLPLSPEIQHMQSVDEQAPRQLAPLDDMVIDLPDGDAEEETTEEVGA